MTKHTPEPWRGTQHGVMADWPSVESDKGALIARTYGGNAQVDMSRIVACVNACASIPTEALEDCGRAENVNSRLRRLGIYTAQLRKDDLP